MAVRLPFSSLWVRTGENLLWLGNAGQETRRHPDYYFDCRKRLDRPHHVLQFTLSGSGFYERKRSRTILTPGMAFLDRIPGNFEYGYPPEAKVPYQLVFACFTGSASDALCERIIREFGNIFNFGTDSPIKAMLLSIQHQYSVGTLRDRYLISGTLYQLLMAVLTTLKSSQLATTPLLHGAMALVDALGSDHHLNVNRIATQLGCSREHLTRQFRDGVGVSAGDYLMQHRLGLASSRLRQTSEKLDVVAGKCGFASANYFCRAFRKRYGITPAQFRKTPWLITE